MLKDNPDYALDPALVNQTIETTLGQKLFGPFGSYDNELGRFLIERALARKVFTLGAELDPALARTQIDAALAGGGGGPSYDAATTAWAAAVVTNGGTVSDARKTLVCE